MAAEFDVTPQKEGSMLSFFRRQLFHVPAQINNVSLSGLTAVVTGSNVGVGFACCQHFIDLGVSKLILAVRDEAKGRAAAAELAKSSNPQQQVVEVWRLDLQSYESVEAFANRTKSIQWLDILVLNAAIKPIKQILNTSTGHDENVQVNYRSTALLLILLLQVIQDGSYGRPTRITIISTDAAAWTSFKARNNDPLRSSLDKPANWDAIDRHFVTKLLMQLFVAELTAYVPASLAVINMVTPGIVYDTEITREARTIFAGKVEHLIKKRIGFTSPVAARFIVDAAVNHGSETHGQYLSENRIKPMAPIIYFADGARLRAKLWKETMAEFSFCNPEQILQALSPE